MVKAENTMRKKYLFLIFILFFTRLIHAKTIYIVPYPQSNPDLIFFDLNSSQDEYGKKWIYLREDLERIGYHVKFTWDAENLDDFTALFSVTNINAKLLENLKSYPKDKCWLFVLEPPVYLPKIYNKSITNYFGKIFVMFDDLVNNKEYLKFYYPQPRSAVNNKIPDFANKKLCVLIAGNKKSNHTKELYSERQKVIHFFSNLPTDEFDLYGNGWEGYKKWRGPIKKKWDVLKNYKFCICYENMKDQLGYITEKIFDCLVSGCVPVYWGASNISDYVHKECYIDRRAFRSEQELYEFLNAMDQNTYQHYLQAAKRYLASPEAKLFSIDNFIKIIKTNLAKID